MITPVAASRSPADEDGTLLEADGATLRIMAPALRAEAEIRVEAPAEVAWIVGPDGAELVIGWPAGPTLLLRVTCLLHPSTRPPSRRAPASVRPSPAQSTAGPAGRLSSSSELVIPDELRPALERISARARRNVLECTALRAGPGHVAILTDHRLLPLSWTRDAYYQVLLLLGDGETDLVGHHLRWLWFACDRPAATWARSHHADGRRMDEVHQVDQQLFPILELADYWRSTGGLPELDGAARAGSTWSGLVSDVLRVLESSLSPAGLLPTEENAADDPLDSPYLLSSQILAWYTFIRLAEMRAVLDVPHPLSEMAERIRRGVDEHFVVDGPFGRQWAYAVDDEGRPWLHQDAGDFPTVFAPWWGFCSASDPLWRRTMDFAFSPANDAYSVGEWGGLGSHHTPGTWPLGLIQEWIAMSIGGETERAADALWRVVGSAFVDGSLPEASDSATGRFLARHWFAWPGALVGALFTADSQRA